MYRVVSIIVIITAVINIDHHINGQTCEPINDGIRSYDGQSVKVAGVPEACQLTLSRTCDSSELTPFLIAKKGGDKGAVIYTKGSISLFGFEVISWDVCAEAEVQDKTKEERRKRALMDDNDGKTYAKLCNTTAGFGKAFNCRREELPYTTGNSSYPKIDIQEQGDQVTFTYTYKDGEKMIVTDSGRITLPASWRNCGLCGACGDYDGNLGNDRNFIFGADYRCPGGKAVYQLNKLEAVAEGVKAELLDLRKDLEEDMDRALGSV